jgi:hypothetical protein
MEYHGQAGLAHVLCKLAQLPGARLRSSASSAREPRSSSSMRPSSATACRPCPGSTAAPAELAADPAREGLRRRQPEPPRR